MSCTAPRTQRAVLNFPVSGRPVPRGIIQAYGLLKAACATVNLELKRLRQRHADRAIVEACAAASAPASPAHGGWQKHFPVDIYQTGSGTSTNMNANEVIANLAQSSGSRIGLEGRRVRRSGGVHPNDHVNMGQSSNDTFPTAMHIAAAVTHHKDADARRSTTLADELDTARPRQWDKIVKIGRTHLMDATPIRVGQVFGGYASQMQLRRWCAGGPRAGRSGENCRSAARPSARASTRIADFGRLVSAELTRADQASTSRRPRTTSRPRRAKDSFVEATAELKTIAVIAHQDRQRHPLARQRPALRHLRAARCPQTQPGSSIMPGKVNPVICESRDAGRLPGDRQRRGRHLRRPRRRQHHSSSSTSPCP